MFAYCLNNPTNMIDTVGQFPRFIYEQNKDTEVSGTGEQKVIFLLIFADRRRKITEGSRTFRYRPLK